MLKQGSAFALIYGSQWSKDGVQQQGDGHVPKREHITLDSEDIARLTQILVDYGIEPLKGRNDHAVFRFGSCTFRRLMSMSGLDARLCGRFFSSTARWTLEPMPMRWRCEQQRRARYRTLRQSLQALRMCRASGERMHGR